MPLLSLSPEKIDFGSNISPHKTYQETLTVTNTLSSPVTFGLRCSAPGRLSVSPAQCTIEAGSSENIYIKLNLNQATIGHKTPKVFRDTLFIQSTYFQQKVSISFALAGDSPAAPPLTPTPDNKRASTSPGFGLSGGHGGKSASVSFAEDSIGPTTPGRGISGGGSIQSNMTNYRSLIDTKDPEAKSEKIYKLLQHKDKLIEKLTSDLATATSSTEALKATKDQTHLELTNMQSKYEKKVIECDELKQSLSEAKDQLKTSKPAHGAMLDGKSAEGRDVFANLELAKLQLAEQQDQIEVLVGEIARLQSSQSDKLLSVNNDKDAITKQFQSYEQSLRELEVRNARLEESLKNKSSALERSEKQGMELASKYRETSHLKKETERELFKFQEKCTQLEHELEEKSGILQQDAIKLKELSMRCASLEELQEVARETLTKSEARLRESVMGGRVSSIGDEDLMAVGEPITNNHHHAAVQLWWVELAQQSGQTDKEEDDEERALTSKDRLEQQLREQGLEVVFLRQELIAREVELRRLKEDTSIVEKKHQRRVAALEQAVKTASEEHRSRILDLEHTITQLSSRSDLHLQLSDAKHALASERASALHRSADLDALQRLREADLKENQELASQVQQLKRKLDECSVAQSLKGVSGVNPCALIDHFTGVAKLQAERIRQLGETLTDGFLTKKGSGMKQDKALFGKDVGMWGTHWIQLEAHLLSKQNSELKVELERLHSKHDVLSSESKKEINDLKQELVQLGQESNTSISALRQRSELAESRSSLLASHLKKETERSALFEQNIAKLKDELEANKEEAMKQISALKSPYAIQDVAEFNQTHLSPSASLNNSFGTSSSDQNNSRRILELESLLKERSSQVGVLMDTVDALQVATAASASANQHVANDGTNHEDAGDATAPSWALNSMKKQLIKLSVDYSAALASAGMQERRSAHLARIAEDAQNENSLYRRQLKQLEVKVNELEAARVAAREETVKQKQTLKTEVNALMLDVELQRLSLESMESEVLRLKDLEDDAKEKITLLERELKVYRAKSLTSSLYSGGGIGSVGSDSPYPTIEPKPPTSQATDDLIFKLIEAVNTSYHPKSKSISSANGHQASSEVSELINKLDDLVRHCRSVAEAEHERAEAESYARQCCEEALNNCKRERHIEALRGDRLREGLAARVKTDFDIDTRWVDSLIGRIHSLYNRLEDSVSEQSQLASEVTRSKQQLASMGRRLTLQELSHDKQFIELKGPQTKSTGGGGVESLSSAAPPRSSDGDEIMNKKQKEEILSQLKQWIESEITDFVNNGDVVSLTESLCTIKQDNLSLRRSLETTLHVNDNYRQDISQLKSKLKELLASHEQMIKSQELDEEAELTGNSLNSSSSHKASNSLNDVLTNKAKLERENFKLDQKLSNMERRAKLAEGELGALKDTMDMQQLHFAALSTTVQGQEARSGSHANYSDILKAHETEIDELRHELNISRRANEALKLAMKEIESKSHSVKSKATGNKALSPPPPPPHPTFSATKTPTKSSSHSTPKSTPSSKSSRASTPTSHKKQSSAVKQSTSPSSHKNISDLLHAATNDAAAWQERAHELSRQLELLKQKLDTSELDMFQTEDEEEEGSPQSITMFDRGSGSGSSSKSFDNARHQRSGTSSKQKQSSKYRDQSGSEELQQAMSTLSEGMSALREARLLEEANAQAIHTAKEEMERVNKERDGLSREVESLTETVSLKEQALLLANKSVEDLTRNKKALLQKVSELQTKLMDSTPAGGAAPQVAASFDMHNLIELDYALSNALQVSGNAEDIPGSIVTLDSLIKKTTLLKEYVLNSGDAIEDSTRRVSNLEAEVQLAKETNRLLTGQLESCRHQLAELQKVCDPEAELKLLSETLGSLKQGLSKHSEVKFSSSTVSSNSPPPPTHTSNQSAVSPMSKEEGIRPPLVVAPTAYPAMPSKPLSALSSAHKVVDTSMSDLGDRTSRWEALKVLKSDFDQVLASMNEREASLLRQIQTLQEKARLNEQEFDVKLKTTTSTASELTLKEAEKALLEKSKLLEELSTLKSTTEAKHNQLLLVQDRLNAKLEAKEILLKEATSQLEKVKKDLDDYKLKVDDLNEKLKLSESLQVSAERSAAEAIHMASEKSKSSAHQVEVAQQEVLRIQKEAEEEKATYNECAKSIAEQFAKFREVSQSLNRDHEISIRDLRKREALAKHDAMKRHSSSGGVSGGGKTSRSSKRGGASGGSCGKVQLPHDVTANTRLLDAMSARDEEVVQLKSHIHSLRVDRDTAVAEAEALRNILSSGERNMPCSADSEGGVPRRLPIATVLADIRLSVATAEAKSLSHSLDEQRREVERLKTSLAAATATATATTSILGDITSSNKLSDKTCSEGGGGQSNQKSRIAALQSSVASLRSEIAVLREERGDAVNMTQEISNLRCLLNTSKEEVARKTRALSAIQTSRAQLESDKKELEEKLEVADNKVKKMTLELSRRKLTIDKLEKEVGHGENAADTNQSETKSTHQKLKEKEKEVLDLQEELKTSNSDKSRLKQQVTVLRAKIMEQDQYLNQFEEERSRVIAAEEKIAFTVASLNQKETSLKVAKAKLQAAEMEMEELRAATTEWQQEAEKRIKQGQRRVDIAETRANQAEVNASMTRLNHTDNEKLVEAKEEAISELQRLRSTVMDTALELFKEKIKAKQKKCSEALAAEEVNGEGGKNNKTSVNQSADDSDNQQDDMSWKESPDDLIGTGYIASLLDLNADELQNIMNLSKEGGIIPQDTSAGISFGLQRNGSGGGAPSDMPKDNVSTQEMVKAFHQQLTSLLEAPVKAVELQELILSIVQERLELEMGK